MHFPYKVQLNVLVLMLSMVSYDVVLVSGQLSHDPDELLNWCIDAKYHKTEPGPEDDLHKQCTPWKDRSCCTLNTTMSLYNSGHYGSDWNHCGPDRRMSLKCRRHFIQDLCFYECEPNLGPWSAEVNTKIRKERFIHVPLCASDCDTWYEDCKQDYTCVDNWTTKLVWKNGKGFCPVDTDCIRIEEMFKDSKDFCESIFDESWKYTPDNESCMRLYFNSTYGNPNRAVAERRVEELVTAWKNSQSKLVVDTLHVSILLVLLVLFHWT